MPPHRGSAAGAPAFAASFPLLHFSLLRCHRNSRITWLAVSPSARAHSKVISPISDSGAREISPLAEKDHIKFRPFKGGVSSSHVELELIPLRHPAGATATSSGSTTKAVYSVPPDSVGRIRVTGGRCWTVRRMFVVRRLTPSRRTYMSAGCLSDPPNVPVPS